MGDIIGQTAGTAFFLALIVLCDIARIEQLRFGIGPRPLVNGVYYGFFTLFLYRKVYGHPPLWNAFISFPPPPKRWFRRHRRTTGDA